MESRVIMNEVRSSADLAIVNECWLRQWTPSRAARAILSFQPVLERIQYLHFIIFWKKEWKLNRNIGSSKLNSPLSFFLFSLLSSFPFPFSFSLFFFCTIAPPAPKICPYRSRGQDYAKKIQDYAWDPGITVLFWIFYTTEWEIRRELGSTKNWGVPR